MTLRVRVCHGKPPSAKFSDHRYCGSGDIMVLVCHVISHDYVMQMFSLNSAMIIHLCLRHMA